jgi:hypothetical protein
MYVYIRFDFCLLILNENKESACCMFFFLPSLTSRLVFIFTSLHLLVLSAVSALSRLVFDSELRHYLCLEFGHGALCEQWHVLVAELVCRLGRIDQCLVERGRHV